MKAKSTKKFEVIFIDKVFKEIKYNTNLRNNNEDEKSEKIYINPPPPDNRCECCDRHISELKPFGGPGDPLIGNFTGALLLKNFRCIFERQVDASWECRDCILLNNEEFRKIKFGLDKKISKQKRSKSSSRFLEN